MNTANQITSANLKILLIEDDKVDRMIIVKSVLKEEENCHFDYAITVQKAKSLLRKNTYDIIISDMNLPDSSGMDTITKLLSLSRKTPIVILSGIESDSIALEAIHRGAQEYIPKHYMQDSYLLARTIRHAIERNQLKISLEATKEKEKFFAYYDQCTSLPNRLLFLDRLQQVVKTSQREMKKFSIFFIDLDKFKEINDSFGHDAGDTVLKCISKRMKSILREEDTVARFGGDEFGVILNKVHESKQLQSIAKKLTAIINQPITYKNNICSVGVSIGIACYPRHGYMSELLLKNADIAMYEAKRKGRNQFCFFTPELFDKTRHTISIENALRQALQEPSKNFALYFQPKVNLQHGSIYSVEALIRWHHTQLGTIHPNNFISLAEDLGLIEQIDKWVLEQACRQITLWQSNHANIKVSINISSCTFNRCDFVESIVKPTLNQFKINNSSIEIEINEDLLLDNIHHIKQQLKKLNELDISIAINGFGKSFSFLDFLKDFPVNTLKIDSRFLSDKINCQQKIIILKAIIEIGKALNLNVVAEGIETEEQMELIKSLHCQEGQGFFFGEPSLSWIPQKKEAEVIPLINNNQKNSTPLL